MTPDELNTALDAMELAAADNPEQKPGLITVQSDHWISTLGAIKAKCAALHDGLRHRNIYIRISREYETKVLTRAEAGDRGEPYRDLTPLA